MIYWQCINVLDIDKTNVKAFYRRGACYLSLGDAEAALADFNQVIINQNISNLYATHPILYEFSGEKTPQVLQYEPTNKAALNQATLCKQAIKDYKHKQKKLYANMFSKFAQADIKVN